MSQVLDELTALLTLETIEEGIYRGQSQDLGFRALFGGQVMGQAVSAAQETIAPTHNVHSLHSYFLRAGDATKPVVYQVENIRDGKSFSTRRVSATQYGKEIFFMTASFQKPEIGFDHQDAMPDVPAPEGLTSKADFMFENRASIPEAIRDQYLREKPIEIRPVEHYNWFNPKKSAPKSQMWFKSNGALPDDMRIHTYLLAYSSDFDFLTTAIYPHAVNHWQPNFQLATLDHSMWFHRPFRIDEWLLYDIESPSASGGRGLVKGKIYSRDGQLVASTMQEGVVRQR